MKQEFKPNLVIDASNAILGRLSAYTAKQLLLGKSVALVNCNKVLITGRQTTTTKNYKQKVKRGGSGLKGPLFPKSPEKIVKRTIRGMLEYRKGRGEDAFARIRCYNDVPKEFEAQAQPFKQKPVQTRTITLQQLSKLI